MPEIPSDINITKLPGPKRGKHPALYFQDEIVWSPDKTSFALAYTITEASMGNDIGCFLWGRNEKGKSKILENPTKIYASCWQQPWCSWIDNETFIFKAQRYCKKTVHVPLVAININKGFFVIPESNSADKWLPENVVEKYTFSKFNEGKLLKMVCDT